MKVAKKEYKMSKLTLVSEKPMASTPMLSNDLLQKVRDRSQAVTRGSADASSRPTHPTVRRRSMLKKSEEASNSSSSNVEGKSGDIDNLRCSSHTQPLSSSDAATDQCLENLVQISRLIPAHRRRHSSVECDESGAVRFSSATIPSIHSSSPPPPSPPPRRRISFTSVDIAEHGRLLGDHPDVSSGAPITIGWKAQRRVSLDFEDYESCRERARRSREEMIIPNFERRQMMKHWGYSNKEIDEASRVARDTKKKRAETIKRADTLKGSIADAIGEMTKSIRKMLPSLKASRSKNKSANAKGDRKMKGSGVNRVGRLRNTGVWSDKEGADSNNSIRDSDELDSSHRVSRKEYLDLLDDDASTSSLECDFTKRSEDVDTTFADTPATKATNTTSKFDGLDKDEPSSLKPPNRRASGNLTDPEHKSIVPASA